MNHENKLTKRINIFLCFIFLYPIIIEVLLYLLNRGVKSINWDIKKLLESFFSTIKTYMSFYGTALSITFTVLSFLNQQEKYEEERKVEEIKRQEEQQKTNDLKEKELEAKRDYYRPTFIVELNKADRREYVKVFMRNENLYLEQLKYYSSPNNLKGIVRPAIKSGETIAPLMSNSFYITAKTQIGETILFGYLNNGVKLYKYLKDGDKAIIPTFGRKPYNQKEVDEIWGTYNDDIEYADRSLDQILFYDTVGIRQKIVFNYNNSISRTLASKTLDEFFKSVFHDIVDEFNSSHFTSTSVYDSVRSILSDLNSSDVSMEVSDELKESNDYLYKQLKNISYRKKNWQALFKSNVLDIGSFLNLAIETLNYGYFELDEEERCTNYKALLRILMTVFDCIDIDTSIDFKIYDYKSIIYNKLVFIN